MRAQRAVWGVVQKAARHQPENHRRRRKGKRSTGKIKRSETKRKRSGFRMTEMLQIVRATASTTANEVRKALERKVELERMQGRAGKKRKRKE